jgi:hypothetical protein
VVEKHRIPYRIKDTLVLVVLADKKPIEYRNGIIRIETKSTKLQIAGIECQININIIDLGGLDMLISYN